MKSEKRYQDCSIFGKLWRRRYYIPIPFVALKMRIKDIFSSSSNNISFSTYYAILKGLAQGKMKWYYTLEESEEKLKRRINKIREKNV